MAGIKSIQASLVDLEEALLSADLLRQAMDQVAAETPSPVMEVYARSIFAVHKAAYSYIETVAVHAMPILVDHEKVMRRN